MLTVGFALLAAAACGSEAAEPSGSESPAPTQMVVPMPGPLMLPPLGSASLASMSLDRFTSPDEIDARLEQYGPYDEWANGPVVFYGDPRADDPFAEPWVLAVLNQGSENSGISDAFDAQGTATAWRDVEVEQLSQELRQAALLAHGVDDATLDRLAVATEATHADDRSSIEVAASARESAPVELQQIAAGRLDVGGIADGLEPPAPGPNVWWSDRVETDDTPQYRSLSITSYAADPALELLLRATNGGTEVGPSLMPQWGDTGDVRVGVRTIGDATVLVQAVGFDDTQLEELLDATGPFDDLPALTTAWAEQPPATDLPDASATLVEPVLDGRLVYEVSAVPARGAFGEHLMCNTRLRVEYPDGTADVGAAGGGDCTPAGTVGVVSLRRGLGSLVHGELPGDASTIRVTLDDGSVHEPELTGTGRRVFAVVVEGTHGIAGVSVLRADGSVSAALGEPVPAQVGASTAVALEPPG